MRKYDLSINDNPYSVVIKDVTDRDARVEVNGVEHIVSINKIQTVLPETIPTAKKAAPVLRTPTPSPSTSTTTAGSVIAPMPGQIKAILVREGDRVQAGQKLLVMEAMKLENKLPASKDGLVKHILVRDGDIVSQGQELIIIE